MDIFAKNDNEPVQFPIYFKTQKEFGDAIGLFLQPIKDRAFEEGRRAAIKEEPKRKADALDDAVMVAWARLLAEDKGLAAKKKSAGSPADLAKRAAELQKVAAQENRALSNIEAVQAAYAEAGIAWK